MKKPNNTSWEALEKAWQKQIQAHESEVPANMWERMGKQLDEKRVRPIWLRMNTWVWSAAAVIAILIGLNWESSIDPAKTAPTVTQVENKQPDQATPGELPVLASHEAAPEVISKEQKQKEPEQVYTPSIESGIILNDQQPDLAKVDSKPEAIEEIWVRVDIDPIESPKPLSVAQLDATPTKKRKGLLGRLIKQVKQVVAGEELDWQQLKEGNRPLEEGIHQVANTYYRTEQTVKQTFQIQ
jgi:hypothetical protein